MDFRKQTAWELAPYLRKEGMFEGSVVRLKAMTNTAGCQILLRVNNTTKPEATKNTLIPANVLSEIYKEREEANGSVIIGIYFANWKYRDDENGEINIEELLSHLRPGHPVKIRMSKNWKGNRYYCRYIKNMETGEWSGYADEADWRQKEHPYNYFPKSGETLFRLTNITPYTDDFDSRSYSVEVYESKRGSYGIWRCIIPAGSEAAKILRAYEKSDEGMAAIEKREVLCTTVSDPETGKSFITDINLSLPEIRKVRGRKKPGRKVIEGSEKHNYAELKKASEHFEKIPNTEYDQTGGEYAATVLESDLIDYRRADIPFLPLRLSDGRTVMPELNPKVCVTTFGKIVICKNNSAINLLRRRKLLFPGMQVRAYFGKNRRNEFMTLKGLFSNLTEDEAVTKKAEWMKNKFG